MILEYAQLLSTAHRVIDGEEIIEKTSNNRKIKRWKFSKFDDRENILYKSTHINHPSAVWVRKSKKNYIWLYQLFCHLCDQYTYRYNKIHLSDRKLRKILKHIPCKMDSINFTNPPKAMPNEYKTNNVVESYKIFYIYSKSKFAKWVYTEKPSWYFLLH